MVDYTPRTWVTGEKEVAQFFNAEIRQPLAEMQKRWGSYPVAMDSWTLDDGTLESFVLRVGKTVYGRLLYTVGANDDAASNNVPRLLLPVRPHPSYVYDVDGNFAIGHATYADISAGITYGGFAILENGYLTVTYGQGTTGGAPPFTWAEGDTLSTHFVYEAA